MNAALPRLLQRKNAAVRQCSGAAVLGCLMACAAANDAGVWPAAEERRADLALRPAGAQQAKAHALYLQAAQVLASSGPKAALPLFREVMALDPDDSALAGRVGSLAVLAGQPDEARRLLEEAVKKNPDAEGPAVALARFLLTRQQDSVQDYAAALESVRKLQAKFPGSGEACALAVRLYVGDQRRDEAQAAVRQTIARGSQSPEFWLRLSGIAREAFPLDDPDTRAAHLAIVAGCVEKAAALAPVDPDVIEAAADFYARLQMNERAGSYYQKLAALQPGDLTARRKLGQVLRLTGDTAGALKLFEELVRIDESDAVAHRALASMHEAAGRAPEALRHRAELLRIEGGGEKDYLKLAGQLDAARMSDERRLTLERGFFKHPKSPRLAIALAGALQRTGKLKEAMALYEEAVPLASTHDPAALDDAYYIARAECARDNGERETAAIHFRKAIDATPRGKAERAVPAYTGLALLWLEDGKRLDEARELLRLADSLKKDDPGVARAIALYDEKKKVRDAEKSVQKN
jgi:tetratricopeptide (TPR) repeat protein